MNMIRTGCAAPDLSDHVPPQLWRFREIIDAAVKAARKEEPLDSDCLTLMEGLIDVLADCDDFIETAKANVEDDAYWARGDYEREGV